MSEIIEATVSAEYAERWADRARLDLEASADRGLAGMTKIRTAIAERHDVALGYKSLGAYLSDKYADALTQVCRVFGVDFRREVVKELTAAGMSTRAIAPVVGVNRKTVERDVRAGGTCVPPEPQPLVNTETGEIADDYELPAEDAPTSHDAGTEPREAMQSPSDPTAARPVTGLDGKTYSRSASKPRRAPITDAFWKATYDLGKRVTTLTNLAADNRLAKNADQIRDANLADLTRARDELQLVIDKLTA